VSRLGAADLALRQCCAAQVQNKTQPKDKSESPFHADSLLLPIANRATVEPIGRWGQLSRD